MVVVVARRRRGWRQSGGRTIRVGRKCTSVRGAGGGERTRDDRRKREGRPGYEKRCRGLEERGQGLPSPPDMGHSAIDADIESLYRRSPSHDLPYVTSRSPSPIWGEREG